MSSTASNAQNPDLDWSQVRETINMLTLAVAQIESTMTDGEKSVTELSNSFTFIASRLQDIAKKSGDFNSETSSNASELSELISSVELDTQDIHQRVMNAIVAFQFYDRLSQRLSHVKRDLGWLSDLVSNPQTLYNPMAWKKLQDDITSNYTMEEERIMFQHIMKGASVDQALEIYQHHFEQGQEEDDDTGDEVELF